MAIVTPVSTPPGARRRLALASPASGEPLGEIEVATAEDVQAYVQEYAEPFRPPGRRRARGRPFASPR